MRNPCLLSSAPQAVLPCYTAFNKSHHNQEIRNIMLMPEECCSDILALAVMCLQLGSVTPGGEEVHGEAKKEAMRHCCMNL